MVFEWDPDSMFLNYAAAGAYINIGGVNAENRAEVSLNEEKIKKVLTKYAQLKDAFGIDRNTVSLKECADLFSTGNMLYTVLDADSLAEINVTDVDYGILSILQWEMTLILRQCLLLRWQ